MHEYVRLRQICLAAPELAPAEEVLAEILGIEPSHRAPELEEEFGLENVVFPVNGSFIEIIAPLREGTSVSRFLSKAQENGLYIVIVDCADLDKLSAGAAREQVRIAHAAQYPGARNIQLHPRDMGGVMLEIDQHANGDETRFGHFEWAGPNWREHVRTDVTVDMLGVDLRFTDPDSVVRRWARILERDFAMDDGLYRINLDHGALRFLNIDAPGTPALSVVRMSVHAPDEVVEKARRAGCRTFPDAFVFCDVLFRLAPPGRESISNFS